MIPVALRAGNQIILSYEDKNQPRTHRENHFMLHISFLKFCPSNTNITQIILVYFHHCAAHSDILTLCPMKALLQSDVIIESVLDLNWTKRRSAWSCYKGCVLLCTTSCFHSWLHYTTICFISQSGG